MSNKYQKPSHSQYAKNVVLLLYENGRFIDTPVTEYSFLINPEEFSINRPDRARVVYTIGDPFIDDFGLGLTTIKVRGTTGWRGRTGANGIDGYEAYRKLHRQIHDEYFRLRQQKVENGQDPDAVRLILANNVDNLVYDVIPTEFNLLRSKSRPLLYQFDLTFKAVFDFGSIGLNLVDLTGDVGSKTSDWQNKFSERQPFLKAAVDSASQKISEFTGSSLLKNSLGKLSAASSKFVTLTKSVLENIQLVSGSICSVVNLTSGVLDTGLRAVKGFNWDLRLATVPLLVAINDLQSTFNEIKCYFDNGIDKALFPDYSFIYGVTDCATTRGVKASTDTGGIGRTFNMEEIVRQSNDIGYADSVGEVSTPLYISSDYDVHMTTVIDNSANVESFSDVVTLINNMTILLDSVGFDPSKVELVQDMDKIVLIDKIKTVIVEENDSLQSIAYRELGSADRWRDIAVFNDIVVENVFEIFMPTQIYSVNVSTAAGQNILDYGVAIPSQYGQVNDLLRITDVTGSQQLKIKAVTGSLFEFHETFSRTFESPIKVEVFKNMADVGKYDSETTIANAVSIGSSSFALTEIKNIHLGYLLYLKNGAGAEIHEVSSVDYLNKTVSISPNVVNIGYEIGNKVHIFDPTSRMHNLVPGCEIKVPVMGAKRQTLVQSYEDIFGIDLEIDKNGFLKISSGDFAVIRGLENLKQSVYHRLMCPFKSIIWHPEYGCGLPSILGHKNSAYRGVLVRAAIIDALNYEPRIVQISNFQSNIVGDAIHFTATAQTAVQNTQTDLNFVFGG